MQVFTNRGQKQKQTRTKYELSLLRKWVKKIAEYPATPDIRFLARYPVRYLAFRLAGYPAKSVSGASLAPGITKRPYRGEVQPVKHMESMPQLGGVKLGIFVLNLIKQREPEIKIKTEKRKLI